MRKWNLDKYIKGFYKEKYNKVLDKLSQKYGKENGEDIIQEALLKFSQYYNESKGEPDKYFQVILNTQIKHYLKSSSKFDFEDINIEYIADNSIPVDETTETEIIYNELSEIFKDSIVMTYKQVGEKHGLTIKQVDKKLYAERKKLRERWK